MSDDKQQKAALEYTYTVERIHYVHQEWNSLLENEALVPTGKKSLPNLFTFYNCQQWAISTLQYITIED